MWGRLKRAVLTFLGLRPRGNPACWDGAFHYERCCRGSGDPACWQGVFKYSSCCFSPGDPGWEPFEPTRPSAQAGPGGRAWRVVAEGLDGSWLVHELEFHRDAACTGKLPHLAPLQSGASKDFPPRLAFDGALDLYASGPKRSFWFSLPQQSPWLGASFFAPVQVRCVRLWHHNLPSLRVRVEMRNAAGAWEALGSYDAAGAQWVQLSLSSANEL